MKQRLQQNSVNLIHDSLKGRRRSEGCGHLLQTI